VGADHVNAAEGSAAAIPVMIAREEGFKGDVEVTAQELPAGWTVTALRISGGEDSGKLEIRGHGSAALHIVARAKISDKEEVQQAFVPPVSPEDGPGFLELPRNTVHVAFVEPPAYSLSVEPPPSGFVLDRAKGQPLEIRCKIERCAECATANEPLKFDVEDLPAGMRLESQQAAADGESAILTLAADLKAVKPGQYRLALRANAIVNGRERSETTSAMGVRVK
jgi:hypothetical protein